MIKNNTIPQNHKLYDLSSKTKGTITFSSVYMYIIIGFALNFFTVQVFYLQYILPFIGSLLFTIGFSTLKKGNSEFKNAFICSLLYVLVNTANLILLATPFHESEMVFIEFVRIVLQLFVILYFVSALKEVFHQVNKKESTVLNYIWIEYLTITAFTFFTMVFQEFSFLFTILVLCLYITILVQFLRVKQDIHQQNIIISTQKTYKILPIILFLLLLITTILASLYISEQREIINYVSWNNDNAKAEKQTLKKKGLPDALLKDLRPDDMIALNNVSNFQHKRQKLIFYNPILTKEYTVDVYYGYENDSVMQFLVYFDFDKLETQNTLSFMSYIQSSHTDGVTLNNKTSIVSLYDKDDSTYLHYASAPFTTQLSKGKQHRGYVLLSYKSDYPSSLLIIPSIKYKNVWNRYPYTNTSPLSSDLLSASTDNVLTALTYDTTGQFQIVLDAINIKKTRGVSPDTKAKE